MPAAETRRSPCQAIPLKVQRQVRSWQTAGVSATDVPVLTDEEKRLLVRMFHVQKITDDEIVFVNKAKKWQNAVWIGALWLLGQGATLAYWLIRWDHKPPPTEPWYLYPILVMLGLPIIALTVRRADQAKRTVILRRGKPAVTVRLGDREWTILLPRGVAPTEVWFSSATIPWRRVASGPEAEKQAAAETLVRFTAARENRQPGDARLFDLQETGVDVVGLDDESVSIAGGGNVRVRQVVWGAFAIFGNALLPVTASMVALLGALIVPHGFELFETVPSSFVSWTFFWLLSLPGPFILVREMSHYNVMTFWRGKSSITLYTEGKIAPWNSGIRPTMIRLESLGGDPGGNVAVAGFVWGCTPQYGHEDFLVEYLREIVKPAGQRKPEFSL